MIFETSSIWFLSRNVFQLATICVHAWLVLHSRSYELNHIFFRSLQFQFHELLIMKFFGGLWRCSFFPFSHIAVLTRVYDGYMFIVRAPGASCSGWIQSSTIIISTIKIVKFLVNFFSTIFRWVDLRTLISFTFPFSDFFFYPLHSVQFRRLQKGTTKKVDDNCCSLTLFSADWSEVSNEKTSLYMFTSRSI